MNMTQLRTMSALDARIQQAFRDNKISFSDAERAHAAIRESHRYGNKMTAKSRDSILTHRFGI